MLKETKKNIRLCCYYFYHRWHFNGEEGGPFVPLATNMTRWVKTSLVMENFIRLLLAKLLLDLQQGSSFAETFLSKIFFSDFSKKIFQLSNI